MSQRTGREGAAYVQNMFARIAQRYDLMNRLMTGGQDIRWRKQVTKLARINSDASLLDIGTGTGDLAFEALKQNPNARVVASDFTLKMMQVGAKSRSLPWCAADALCLPHKDEAFDAVISGFLMRNVIDVNRALQEQYRVLKDGGRIVILDTTRPKQNIFSPLIRIHMHVVIPSLGKIISGAHDAYQYLPDSTEGFLSAEELAARMTGAGFKNIRFRRQMFGTIAIHWGEK